MMVFSILIPNRIARATLVLAGMGFVAPVMADEVNQIAVYGEVAPRCWVADPMKVTTTSAVVQATPARAICNQARPLLVSQVRTIGSNGALVRRVPAATDRQASLSTRTALEIVVTPQL